MTSSTSDVLIAMLHQRVSEAEQRLTQLRSGLESVKKKGDEDVELVKRALRATEELKAIKEEQPDQSISSDWGELDDECRFFLAVARLKERIEELKVDDLVSKRNVQELQQQLQDLNLLLEERETFLTSLRAQVAFSKASSTTSARPTPEELKRSNDESLDRKLRSTTRLYRDFKNHLKDVLQLVDNEEKSKLIQFMWNHFFETKDETGQSSFVKLTDLDFQVRPDDIEALCLVGILEANEDAKDEYRMVSLTSG